MFGKKVGSLIGCHLCVSLVVVAGCSTSGLQSTPSGIPDGTAGSPQNHLAGKLPPAPTPQYDSEPLVPRQFAANAPGAVDRGIQVAFAGDAAELNQGTNPSPSLEPFRPAEEAPVLDKERFETLAQNTEDSAGDAPAGGNAEPSMAEMAQKANNPLSDVWLLITQNDTTILEGDLLDDREVLNSTKLMPVMPVPVLDGDWNLIFRPVLQLVSVPLDKDAGDLFGVNQGEIATDSKLRGIAQDPFGRTTGLGDSVLLTLLGPNRNDGFVWGAGASQIFPTATEEVLGQGKWQAGPSALGVLLGNESGGLGIKNWNTSESARPALVVLCRGFRPGRHQSDGHPVLHKLADERHTAHRHDPEHPDQLEGG